MAGASLGGDDTPYPMVACVVHDGSLLTYTKPPTIKGVHHGGFIRSTCHSADCVYGIMTRPTPHNLCIRSPQNLRHPQDMCGLLLHCSPHHSRGCHQDCSHSLGCTCRRRCPTCGRWSLWMVCWHCMCFLWGRGVHDTTRKHLIGPRQWQR